MRLTLARDNERCRVICGINTRQDMLDALTGDANRLWNIKGDIGYVRAVRRVGDSGMLFVVSLVNNGHEHPVAIRFES